MHDEDGVRGEIDRPDCFVTPRRPAVRHNAPMPLIQISQTPGLTVEQKRATIEAVTKAYAEATGKDAKSVWVTITEVPREQWGVGGVPLG
ncbi:putative tautomerase [Rhodococcus ruber]|nr:putative tautomerase [Rhodococcus ruber]